MVSVEALAWVNHQWCLTILWWCNHSSSQFSKLKVNHLHRFSSCSSLKISLSKLESQSTVITSSQTLWTILRIRITPKALWCLNSWKNQSRIKTNHSPKLRNQSLHHNPRVIVNPQRGSFLRKILQQKVWNPMFQPTLTSNYPATVMPYLPRCATSLRQMLSSNIIRAERRLTLTRFSVAVAEKFKARLDPPLQQHKQLATLLLTTETISLTRRKTSIVCSSKCSQRNLAAWVLISGAKNGRRQGKNRRLYRSSHRTSNHSTNLTTWMAQSNSASNLKMPSHLFKSQKRKLLVRKEWSLLSMFRSQRQKYSHLKAKKRSLILRMMEIMALKIIFSMEVWE